MLEDRPYMRRRSFASARSATIGLIVANALAYLLQTGITQSWPNVMEYLPLSLWGLRHGYIWQLVTFQFMHASFWHLFFNCFAIFIFGRAVEEALGFGNFLKLYFSSGVVGGLFQVAAALLSTKLFGGPVVGASAGGFGLTAAFALLFPNDLILLFFILPMRAKYFLWLAIALAVYGILFPVQNAFGP